MTPYYEHCNEKGLQYQDFVMDVLIKEIGISLSNYSSKKYQYNVGENKQGIEIKYDDKHKETGNIYIEVAEKTNKNNPNYVDSGIMRSDNTWLYLIGDYSTIYVFSKKQLCLIGNTKKIFEIKGGTSKGYLLINNEVEKYVIKKIIVKETP